MSKQFLETKEDLPFRLVPIDQIKVVDRSIKEERDFQRLVQKISKIGLFHPVTINDDNELISGQLRLEACKSLGWDMIPAIRIHGKRAEKTNMQNAAEEEHTDLEKARV